MTEVGLTDNEDERVNKSSIIGATDAYASSKGGHRAITPNAI